MLRYIASRLPTGVIGWLNRVQFRHPRVGRVLRALARRVAAGDGVIRHGPGAGLLIDATGTNSGFLLGTTEPKEQAWLLEHVSAGDVVYEVGANVGFHTLIMARLVGKGRVFAFEPLPANAAQLHRNIQMNGFDNVVVTEVAVTDAEGVVGFRNPDGGRVRAGIVDGPPHDSDVSVVATSIDVWRRRSGAPLPSVIKVDVEGAELAVLRGAVETIRTARPAILVEVHWTGAGLTRFFDEELHGLGYAMTPIDRDEIPEEPERLHVQFVAGG